MKAISIFTALLALTPLAAQAQVRASLVAADSSLQPGRSTTVALRLDHAPHWHTYWVNAGTGYPSSLKWDLPAGWKAGDIQWPTPIKILSPEGDVTGNGYDGVLYLPMTLTAPADAKGEVTLKAKAKWLMCADVCIPGSEDVSLTLPVSADAPKRNAAVEGALARMPMPRAQGGWKMSAMRAGKNVTLTVDGAGPIESAHFFSEDAYIPYDRPQTANAAGGKLTLTLPIAQDVEAGTERLAGILAYKDEQGVYRGAKVNVPFDSGGAAAVAASSTRSGSGSAASIGAASLSIGVLALAFLGGLILNLMPCVFPVLGIKIMGFVNAAGSDRRRVTLHGLIFTMGVLLSFWALAGLLAALRAGGDQLGWGFQLQSAPFVFVLTVVMLIFALSLSGVFEFGVRATGVGAELQMRQGYGGSFFAGVLATVVATPCSAPFLAPALGAALALPVTQSCVVFTVIALGLSAPYLLLSIFPQAIKALPRPGRWMETFKQVMAFPLYATVAYLIWVLAGQTSESGLLSALFGLTVIALGVWLYGRYVSLGTSPGRVRFGFVGGLMLLAFGLHLGWPRAAKASDIVWEPWSTEKVAQLREEGRPIYVDFTARWCATCQANKKLVFSSDAVKEYFRHHNIALLKGDWTNSDPRITAELAKWNRSAVPFNLVYLPGAPEPTVLPEILTPGIVLNAFDP
jgi:thiol:disulfide interchange protein/DsbC/DsbD-like thiol-disulfide interchange protein